MLGALRRWVDWVERGVALACVVAVACMVVVISWQVFSRYVLGTTPYWSEEVARIVLVWVGLLGAALITRHRGHLGVEAFVSRLPARVRRVVLRLDDLLVCAFGVFLAWHGARLVGRSMDQTMPSTGLPVGLAQYLPLVVAGLLITASAAEHLLEGPREETPGGEEGRA